VIVLNRSYLGYHGVVRAKRGAKFAVLVDVGRFVQTTLLLSRDELQKDQEGENQKHERSVVSFPPPDPPFPPHIIELCLSGLLLLAARCDWPPPPVHAADIIPPIALADRENSAEAGLPLSQN